MKNYDLDQRTNTSLVLSLTGDVFEEIVKTIGSQPAESGGAFGGPENGNRVTHFHFDNTSRTSKATYSPDDTGLNSLFKDVWNPQNIRFKGFVHSHPGNMRTLSGGDLQYAKRILSAIDDLKLIWLPIVNTVADTGEFRLTPWAVIKKKDGSIETVRGKVQVGYSFGANSKHSRAFTADVPRMLPLDEIILSKQKKSEPVQTRSNNETFDRVKNAYDLDLMHSTRAIIVGAGGAANFIEELVRAGLGQVVLVDPDTVSETNLATQQTYRRDIGRHKVDCIAERLRDINPKVKIISIKKYLEDIADDEMRGLAFDPIDGEKPQQTIICGLTDNFFAQARINLISLNLGIPSLCAQVYLEGRGAEVTFTYPGVTSACHRCILSSRYRHFYETGGTNDVTSNGTPIFSTTRLNAIKGFIFLAIAHHSSSHPRWGNMLSRIGKRNLIQIRMDPDIGQTLGLTVYDRVFEKAEHERLFFDEAVWLPQDQESLTTGYTYNCPDCGGTGDLRRAIGTINHYGRREDEVRSQCNSSAHAAIGG